MNRKDWDPDDFLDFDYRKPVPRDGSSNVKKSEQEEPVKISDPERSSKTASETVQSRNSASSGNWKGAGSTADSADLDEELKRYRELRRQSREQAHNGSFPSHVTNSSGKSDLPGNIEPPLSARYSKKKETEASPQAEKPADKKRVFFSFDRKKDDALPMDEAENAAAASGNRNRRSPEEIEALKQAQQEAYDRYRGTYSKNSAKKARHKKAGIVPRLLSLIYIIALAAFVVSMTVMDVLPFGIMVALYVVLGLLSLIIVVQLCKANVRKWVRVLASLTAVCLIALFGVGTAYAMGTLEFLDETTVENDKKVGNIIKEPFNVCITGIDVRGEIDSEGRSDVNMVVTVNPVTGQILMTSIPRDYEIYMPDKDNAMDKLTHTGFYGIDTTIGAEEQLLDTTINYYVKVNFSTVQKFIDAIGGIDVYSEYTFNPVKLKDWTVEEGMNHMNGKQALAFARERKAFPTGDRQRIKNQQAVFEAMIKKATSSKTMVMNYSTIMSELKDYFRMSFSSRELRKLVKYQVSKNPDWKIYKNSITGGDGSLPTYSTGGAYAYVMTQDEESITNARKLISAVLNGEALDKDEDGNVIIVAPEGSEEGNEGSEEAGE